MRDGFKRGSPRARQLRGESESKTHGQSADAAEQKAGVRRRGVGETARGNQST